LLAPQLLCLSYLNPMKRVEINGTKGFSVFFVPKVINSGLFNNFTAPAADSCCSEKSAKDESFLAERLLIKPFKQGEVSNPFHIPLNPVLQDRLTDMYKGLRDQFSLQPNQFWPCRGRSYFLEILMLLQNLYAFKNESALDLPLPKGDAEIEESARIMLLHYSNPRFRMAEARGSMNAFRFGARFKRSTGLSPEAYLRRVRLTVAANLLRNTLLAPTDIAVRSGYKYPSAFDRDFNRFYGKAPMAYRSDFPDPYG
jgi:AraC family L-rhamnose operon regulatory protein RhaS